MAIERALGRFETALTLTGQRAPFVVTVALQLASGPPPPRLREALSLVQRRHPMLSVRILERAGRFRFDSRDTPEIPLRVVARGGDGHWMPTVESELNLALDTSGGPLLRCTYLAPPDPGGRAEIVLSFHHAVMDAASGGTLLRELLELCEPGAQARAGRETPPPPIEALLPSAFRGARGAWRRLRFVAAQLADEAAYRYRTRGTRRPPAEPARCRILPVQLEARATAALVRATRRERVTLNAALSAALLLGVDRQLYGGRARHMRYIIFADLRPYLRPPLCERSLASGISMLRYSTHVRPERGFWPLARDVTRQTAAGARRGDKFVALQMAEPLMRQLLRQGTERMATTALSYMGPVRLEPRGAPAVLTGMHAFVSNLGLGPEYTAQARLFRGRLLFDAVYLEGDMDHARARAVAQETLELLRRASDDGGAR